MRRVSPHDFRAWVRDARHGDSVVYYTGFMVADEYDLPPERPQISLARSLAQKAYRRGEVALVQKKRAPHVYEYIAQRTRRRR